MSSTIVKASHLEKTFEQNSSEMDALKDINLEIYENEFITIVGHSGCGKSTLLKIIGGLETATKGIIERNEKEVEGPGPDCGIIFQDHRLLPWMKIKDNVGFGYQGKTKDEKKKQVENHLKLVGLEGFANHYPKQLSGGMSQRAAIARGLINNPPLLLLDEPFGALDALTRIRMQKEIKRIQREKHTTMIMVTHDIEEAIVLGDRIVVMSPRPGKIVDVIKVPPMGHRRNSDDFNLIKKKIYKYLFGDEESDLMVEYYI